MIKMRSIVTPARRAAPGLRRRKLKGINVERGSQGRIWACVGKKCRLVRTRKGYVRPKKRQRSWTKKGNKFFNRRSRRQRRAQGSKIKRKPYRGGVLTRRVSGNFVEVDGRRRAEVVSTDPRTGNVSVIYLDAGSDAESNIQPSRVRKISVEELDAENENRRNTRRAILSQQLDRLKAQEALEEAVQMARFM